MSDSPIERWMRCEISSNRAAELIGVTKTQFNEITTPILFAVEAAVNSLANVTPPAESHSEAMLGDMSLCWCGAGVERLDDDGNLITHRSIAEIARDAVVAHLPIAEDVLPRH